MTGPEKQSQRALCLGRRRAITPPERALKSAAICRGLEALDALQRAGTILSYMATPEEADLTAFHAWAEGEGKTLAFPVSGPDGHMEAYVPHGPDSWERGRYGIPAPIPERSRRVDPGELDAVVLPCVGFDAAGNRLGHGGGYYDRYLPRCPQARRILVAFEAQRLETVATEPTDRRMDVIVTEQQTGQLPQR